MYFKFFDIAVQNVEIQDKNRVARPFFLHKGVESNKIVVVATGVFVFFHFHSFWIIFVGCVLVGYFFTTKTQSTQRNI